VRSGNDPPVIIRPLDPADYRRGLDELAGRDPDLAAILNRLGPPPMWDREPGFPTLVHIILEQQVSLASARAAFDRALEAAGELNPGRLLGLDDATLKRAGFSRQKTSYVRALATAIARGDLDLGALECWPDDQVRAELTRVRGIGRWTADIYLLMALGRPDVWPVGDLALVTAATQAKGLDERPSPEKLEQIGDAWRPWRSVAARLLWHHYLDPESDRGTMAR
jgi:DNA-3-methyladenine glycosylase II